MKIILQKLYSLFLKPTRQGKVRKTRGQSLVEVAIAFPFMIMLLSGVIEFGFMINYYLSLLDATRFAARQFSGADPFDAVKYAADPNWFFYETSMAARVNLDPRVNPAQSTYVGRRIILDSTIDDVIVSAYSVEADGTTIGYPVGGPYHAFGAVNAPSAFDASEISTRHNSISGAPKQGVLIVEVVYNYHQILSLPWMTPFGNPIPMRAYSIFPLISIEPN